jgi:hypothetical protein
VLGVAVGAAGSLLFVTLSFSLVARVARAPSADAQALAHRLGRAAASDRVRLAMEASRVGSWERRLAEAAACPDIVERRDRLSEVVDELAIELGRSSHWGASLLRLQLLGGGFSMILALFGRDLVSTVGAGVAAVVGGVLVAANTGRGRALERRQRELADRLVYLVDPDPSEPAGEPRNRGLRRRP